MSILGAVAASRKVTTSEGEIGGDPHYDKTVLFLRGESANNSFPHDSSYLALASNPNFNANGTVKETFAFSRWGNGSILFPTGFNYLRIPNVPEIYPGTADFTLETWLYPVASPTGGYTAAIWRTDARWSLMVLGASMLLRYNDATITLNATNPISLNAWNFIQLRREDGVVELRLNDNLEAQGESSANLSYYGGPSGGQHIIGAYEDAMPGYFDDYRYSIGIARSAATPTGPFPFTGKHLELNFNGANASTVITDNSSYRRTITTYGNAQLSTARSVEGGSSLLLDGAGDYLEFPWTKPSLVGDFEISAYIYPVVNADMEIFCIGNDAAVNILFEVDSGFGGSGKSLRFSLRSDNGTSHCDFNTPANSLTLNAWQRVQAKVIGSNVELLIDGISVASATLASPLTRTQGFTIARVGMLFSWVPRSWNGNIDRLTIE